MTALGTPFIGTLSEKVGDACIKLLGKNISKYKSVNFCWLNFYQHPQKKAVKRTVTDHSTLNLKFLNKDVVIFFLMTIFCQKTKKEKANNDYITILQRGLQSLK